MAYSATQGSPTRRDAQDAARDVAGDLAGKAADIAEKAGKQIDNAIQGAEGTARQLADQGREATERVQEVAGNLKGAIDKSVKDQPVATLAVAAAFGFVIGALWKS
jgi:ElaB/YqjD/DUF883 family membrane-anchored ribosome-binding protein